MKNFPISPGTRQSTGSVLAPSEIMQVNSNSRGINRRTLSPSMPKGGHVLSIKSSWENRTKVDNSSGSGGSSALKNDHKSMELDQENVNIRPSWNRSKTVKTRNQFSTVKSPVHDLESSDRSNNSSTNSRLGRTPIEIPSAYRQESASRPAWNRPKPVKTTNTRNSIPNKAYEQENKGDIINSSIAKENPMWEEHKTRVTAKKIKDNAWVKQNDTDDTTSLSSHSNEISIGKTLSNISDVSAHSSSQTSNWRYKNARGKMDAAKPSNVKDRVVENYSTKTDVNKPVRTVGQLASKLDESCGLKKTTSSESESSTLNYSLEKISSEDDTSKLQYSLEKLIEDGEEETSNSRPSMNSSKADYDQDKSKPVKSHLSEIEAKLSRDRAAEDRSSQRSIGDLSDLADSLQAYVDLSSRLHEKMSHVPSPSTDSSLVYSMGNADSYDLKKFSYSYSYDASEDPKTADLVQSTLAECRLLLQLSPPPTPMSYTESPKATRAYDFKSPLSMKTYDFKSPTNKNEIPPLVPGKGSTPRGGTPRESLASVISSPANSEVSVGLGKFLQCPCCHKEFTNDITNDKNQDRRPLHSFACDHIICYECVIESSLASPSNQMVACPQCDVPGAFDKAKPVVSRSYCNLVKSIEILNSSKKKGSSEKKNRCLGGDGQDSNCDRDDDISEDRAVPNQIRFSPKREVRKERSTETVLSSLEEQDSEQAEAHVTFSGVPASLYPGEPNTPVSRAEFRFMQRKEKLAQSLEKVNRLLERSKMTRDELALEKVEEDLSEKKEGETVALEDEEIESTTMNDSQEKKATEFGEEQEQEAVSAKDCTPLCETGQAGDDIIYGKGFVMVDKSRSFDQATFQRADKVESARSFEKPTMSVGQSNSSRKAANVEKARSFEKLSIDTLWTDASVGQPTSFEKTTLLADEVLCVTRPPQQIGHKRPKPELHVDTGNYTPVPIRKSPYLDLKDESTISSENESINRSMGINSKGGSVGTSVNDIFRSSPLSPLMSFGGGAFGNGISSEDSSLADRERDNTFLLGPQSISSKSGGNPLLKEKKYGIHRRSPAKDTRAEKQRADPEQHCPQFLPSLTYSTMQDSDEHVGIVCEKGGPISRRAGGSRRFNYLHNAATNRRYIKQQTNYKGVRKSFGKAESFDNGSMAPSQHQPYEFNQHSCSFSPSSNSLRGGLVTHKPKLHRRILNKFTFRGKNQRMQFRK